jgi:ABC-type multidrug transport system fused ATPase/permease subunit
MITNRRDFKYKYLYKVLVNLFSPRDKKLFGVMILVQVLLGFLDLISVILIGLVGSLAVTGISAGKPGEKVTLVLEVLRISEMSVQIQASVLGTAAAILLISKTLIAIYFTRRSLRFISLRSAQISANLLRKVLSQDLQQLKSKSFQTTLYAITGGVDVLAVGVVGTLVLMVSDLSLTIIMISGLFAVDKLIAGATLLFFSAVGFSLHKLLAGRTQRIAQLQTQYGIKSSHQILEVLGAYREIFVKDRREYYADSIGNGRKKLAEIGAEKAFLPNVSKYVFEITTVVGAFLIAAFQFLRTDALQAVTILTIFLAASARISPALLRVQQGLLTLKGSAASAGPSLDLIERSINQQVDAVSVTDQELSKFNATVDVRALNFRYSDLDEFALNDINLKVSPGEIVALVGPSGSGKSTLVDLILGLLRPETGEVRISNETPINCIRMFPGMIGYVPQETSIFEGTIRENVSLGFAENEFSDEQIMKALEIAALKSLVEESPSGLSTLVGERGTRISGGQRQRLGIARAMVTQPKLLIFDEATSALDGQTEHEISESINSLKGLSTVIIIAHRLSTVKNADRIVYLDKGRIISVGTFSEIRSQISDFDQQAKLMGL